MSEHPDDIVWLTTSEAQTYIKISKTTLYECMKDGRLPFYYIKGTRQRRIKKADLDDLMTPGDPEDDEVEEG